MSNPLVHHASRSKRAAAAPSALRRLFALHHLERPEDAMGFWVWRVAHAYQKRFDRAVAELDLTHLQFVVLAVTGWLAGRSAEAAQPATQQKIAEIASIHFAQVSAILQALEGKGFVTRIRGKADARTRVVSLTAAGAAALGRALPIASKLQGELFGPLQQQAALRSRLNELLESWEKK